MPFAPLSIQFVNTEPFPALRTRSVSLRKKVRQSGVCLSTSFLSNSHTDIQTLTIGLLSALLTLPAIRFLRSKTSHGNLSSDLLKLISAVTSDNFHFDRIKPLLTAALTDNRDNALIWDQVYNAVTESLTSPKQLTPPTAFEKAVFDTLF